MALPLHDDGRVHGFGPGGPVRFDQTLKSMFPEVLSGFILLFHEAIREADQGGTRKGFQCPNIDHGQQVEHPQTGATGPEEHAGALDG